MKVKLCYACNIIGGTDSEIIEVDDSTTDDELEDLAREYMDNELQPESWFERINEDEDN